LPTWPARRSMPASWSGCRYTVIGTRAMRTPFYPGRECALRITGAQGGSAEQRQKKRCKSVL
jgi:hypothetical protein